MKWIWLLSKNKKYLFAEHNHSIRADLDGNVFGGGCFGGGKASLDIPEYYLDEYYGKTQAPMFSFGSEALTGNVPEYYKAIGETGSPEFENMLNLTTRDIVKLAGQDAARRNAGRGGALTGTVARKVADASTKMRYADYDRSLLGKQFLLGTSLDTLSGVRSSALNQSGMKNQYQMQKAQLEYQAEAEAAKAKSEMWSNILRAGIGAASMMFMPGIGAATGAGAGIGSAGIGAGGYTGLSSQTINIPMGLYG